MEIAPALKDELTRIVTRNRVVLFMKGTRVMPQCGFSAQVVSILDQHLPKYETVDVLASPELRDGIKVFSEWPTIPQLYVDGKFVGGCDIVREMQENGELEALLGTAVPGVPTVHVTDAARKAISGAVEPGSTDTLRLEIDGSFTHDLYFGPEEKGDVTVTVGDLVLRMDKTSARRADGLRIDYLTRGGASGFALDNPNAPPKVRSMNVEELDRKRKAGEAHVLVDVRTRGERNTANIEGSTFLDDADADLRAMPKDTVLVFQCHHGMRSRAAAERFLAMGFSNVWNLEGGIDAWSIRVDSGVPRY
ncbi:MAG: Grx4 family monothiol glutaredoxin [Polyangiaceae bacterium]